ncbi:MAG TPA: DNA translocase FtsK 4TM domain-containing protein [Candidatus Baltobacteraceae bacterium]|jgi:S-DNA-T family DNA segregation ATPase FtsK/SpoIIIE|nr:DNA translocase FtsK 4TM domain-containing protein [Candidatus Baltobacteraceae bacterium]
MARTRQRSRRALARTRLNLEIIGIAAVALAVLCGIALAAPHYAGSIGSWIASQLRWLFGRAAPLFPVLVILFGAIVFLEVNVPRMIARLGCTALAYFAIVDAMFGAGGERRGGVIGANIWWALHAMIGTVGAWIALWFAMLALTLWLTNVSMKQTIGRVIVFFGGLKPPPIPKLPKLQMELPGHESLREAFALPMKPIAPRSVVQTELEIDSEPPLVVSPPAVVSGILEPTARERVIEYNPTAPPVPPREPRYEEPGEARTYRLPDLSLFDVPPRQHVDDSNRAHILEDTLASFGVGAKVVHIERGPSIARYELRPERGVKISRIASLADDIALALAATSVRIEAPIPGKSAVGIEVPNQTISIVAIREILDSLPNRGQVPPLWMALGKDITGRAVFGDLCKMPHLLVAGATGAGKSVCLNTIIASLLVSATPDQVQMLMIDPKRVELTVYNGIPHLIKDVIADPRLAAGALFEMTKEMEARYERFAKAGVRKIEEYNAKYPTEHLPYVVIIIDELADLMLVAPARVETTIMRLAQLGRATGIHLVVATQRPSVDVITGLIKANVPSRISFAVSSQADSRVILDLNGAERLLGRGDMLFLPIEAPKPVRAQGALITGAEVNRLVEFWARQARPHNLLDVEVVPVGDDDEGRRDVDPLCFDAAKFIIESNYASTAALQSQFSIGHPRAVRVMKQLEEFKVVGQHEGTKPRKILIGLPELELMAPRLGKGPNSQQDLFGEG